ncbi:MAG: [citrate (pro-3S)-lyase] ligase [Bacillota bacterium]
MLDFNNYVEKTIHLNNREEREQIERFLRQNSLRLENDIEYSFALYDGERMVATGSFSSNVLKCIAVDSGYEGMGMAGKVLSRLVTEEFRRGRTHLFIFTKPENVGIFKEMGFYEISRVPLKVALMENIPDGISGFTHRLKKNKKPGRAVGSIVVNANPFTKGHKYLVEKASMECDWLHIFVVWEDRSVFPPEVRYRLVKEGIKHLKNVTVHKGKDYIISNATFPTYFLKQPDEAVKIQSVLDIKIFQQHIAPALGINRRYVGEEPYCPVTIIYNQSMKEMLPDRGIEVFEISRKSLGGFAISASRVRKLLREGELNLVKEMVPDTTFAFLNSEDALSILDKIKN